MPLKRGVRVRGIYSTALARLLIDSGIEIVDASPQLKERFGDEVEERGVALATLKDRDDRRGLVVIGQKPLVQRVLEVVRNAAARSPIVVMQGELYATYVCRVVEPSIVELPGARVGILEDGAKVGELVTAHVVTFRGGKPVLRRGAALVGEYARLVEGQPHEVSEHVRGVQRSLLLSMSMKAGLEGWGVKWRSSARWAEMSELLSELQALKEAASQVERMVRRAEQPSKLTEGELLAFVPLSFDDKARLDVIRSKQAPTVPLHHLLKACGERCSGLVDEAERVFLRYCSPELLSKALIEEVGREFRPGKLRLLHEKIDGETVTLEGECEILAKNPPTFKMTRWTRGSGVYDGLGVARERGDTILSVAMLGSYVLPHAYLSSEGLLKGVYVNLNTPIEPIPPDSLWYVDLCVDVVWTKERGVEIIDLEELRSHRECFNESAVNFYEALATSVAKRLRALEDRAASDVLKVLVELSGSFATSSLTSLLSAS